MSDNEDDVKRTQYIIKPKYKKSVCEEQQWTNTLKNGKDIVVKVFNVYRWGDFIIHLTDKEREELDKKEMVDLGEYDHELIEMWDGGCDFWIDIDNEEDYEDDELEMIHELLYKWSGEVPEYEDEDDEGYSYEKMEHNGWYESDCNVVLTSPCELTKDDETND